MVPWQQEDRDSTRPQLGSLDMNFKQVTIKETGGPKRLLSSEKYNLIKERLAAGGSGSGPAASSSSVGGQTRSSNSGDQFQRMKDVVHPPPGHPFLKTRPSMQARPPLVTQPPSYSLPAPPHLYNPPPIASNLLPPRFQNQPPPSFHIPPPVHSPPPSSYTQPPPPYTNSPSKSKPVPSSLLSGLMSTPTIPRVLSTADILSLVLRLSSVRVPPEAKKSGLLQLMQVTTITESLVHQLLTMENGDILCGLKCVLARHVETQAEDTAEVLELTLAFLNKCLAMQKPSPKLRSLVVGKSRELAVSCGGMSVLEQLVMVSKTRGTNTAKVETMVCQEITQELSSVPAGRLLGTCFSAGDLQGEVANWIQTEFGMDLQMGSSAFIRSVEEKYRVVELSVLREDMTEASLSDPLLAKYPASFWPAVHTVRQDQASPCVCLTVVQFLPTGHILAYTDMDWQKGLVMLDQELQFSQSVPLQTGARDLQAGHMVMVSKADMQLSTPPLHQFTLARAVVLSLSTEEDTARLYLVDHGMQATISTNIISSLPPSLKTLPPRLVLCRVQGITPTPSTKLLAQSIITLSHLINSATAATILLRPTLATPKTLCQLLSSQQTNLITPSMDILHVLASTQTSLKHLITSNKNISCMALEFILPSLLSMLSSCHQAISLRTVCTALETIHCLLAPLLPDQQRKVFSDGKVCSVLEKVEQVYTLGQYQGVLEKILDMDQGRRGKMSREKVMPGQVEKAKVEVVPVFKNTDIRERQTQPQPAYNPHRIVTTGRNVYASVDQLEQSHRGEAVGNMGNREQMVPRVNMEPVVPIVDPDLERRRLEREKLTADAMKLFQQHKGKLDGKSDTEACVDKIPVGYKNDVPSHEVAADIPIVSKAVTPVLPTPVVTPANASLPSWLGGDSSTSSSEEEEDTSGLPPWLAKPSAQPDQVSNLAKTVAKLPFSAALASSSSSSQEEEEDLTVTSTTNSKSSPATTTPLPLARYSPEEFGSGTESGREVQTAMERLAKEKSVEEQIAKEQMVKEQLDKGKFAQEQMAIEQANKEKLAKEQVAKDKMDKEEQQQVLIRDYILSEKHSIGVELWDAERKFDVDNNQLAVLICGFLNTRAGGTLYAGVKRNGLVRGIPLERKDRDTMRQMLDRVLASMINPRVPPNVVDIEFVSVEDKSRPTCPYRLMVVMVKGQKEGLDKVYMAHNLTSRACVEEGAYVRRGYGPNFNTKLSHQEMLRLVEKR